MESKKVNETKYTYLSQTHSPGEMHLYGLPLKPQINDHRTRSSFVPYSKVSTPIVDFNDARSGELQNNIEEIGTNLIVKDNRNMVMRDYLGCGDLEFPARVSRQSTAKNRTKKEKKNNQDGSARILHEHLTEPKRPWTPTEDNELKELVKLHGYNWNKIATMMNKRVGRQCRERWQNYLRPDLKKDAWTEEEELLIIEAHKELGSKWSKIAERLPGRCENDIKNLWYSTKRLRRFPKRKGSDTYPRRSMLKEYILSTMSTSAETNPMTEHHQGEPSTSASS